MLYACVNFNGQEPEAGPEEIYFNFKIYGEEGNDSVTVILKFHEFDAYGPAVLFNGTVLLDGTPVPADSTMMTGPFYAVTKPVRAFTGRHSIVVTAANKKKYKDEFFFKPFAVKPGIGDTLGREKLVLQLEGLDKKDVVRILMTDTSYTGEGINRVDTVWNNKLLISRSDLSFLESGPINMELIRENERPVRSGTAAGGTLSVFYTIRREFWLRD